MEPHEPDEALSLLDGEPAPVPMPRDAGHAPAEAASALGWRNQHLVHPQMLGRSVVMH